MSDDRDEVFIEQCRECAREAGWPDELYISLALAARATLEGSDHA